MAAQKKTAAEIVSERENNLHTIPLRITDTTLRDAHQSLWATRLRTDDIIKIIDAIDNVGYYSLEAWGGATFDVCLRFLRENPWERLRLIKKHAKKTPLQMLLRGQNLVGYRNYSDDVVDRFVQLAAGNGIDIFRVFDALNDTRNLEAAVAAVKKYGKHAQGVLAYTTSPVHTVEKYVQHAREQVALGVDSICIKDMAGILSPIAAERLVSALVDEVKIPIQLHAHATSGMATATYVAGVRAGAGAIDCAVSSMAGSTSQPPVETLVAIFAETNYSAHLDLSALETVAAYFAELAPRRRQGSAGTAEIDPGILIHQIPGGMISNFRSQLAMQNALDKLPIVLDEVTAVRADMGWCPLVTPTSQIVGTQAVMNVLAGERYKMVPKEVKDYVRGLYGRSPAPLSKDIIKKILGDDKPIDHRPADDIPPMLSTVTDSLDAALIEKDEDVISYCLLPEPALEYFKWRALPAAARPAIPADLELQKEQEKAAAAAAPATAPLAASPSGQPAQIINTHDYSGIAQIISAASGLALEEFSLVKGDLSLTVRGAGSGTPRPAASAAAPASAPAAAPAPAPAAPAPAAPVAVAHAVAAPLVGTFYSSPGPGKPPFVKVGDMVKKGQPVCIVEAMKLFNEIGATEDGKVTAILCADGEAVDKDQPLIAYDPS